MTFLIVLASILGYLIVGTTYARSQSVRLYRKAKAEWHYEQLTRESLHVMLAWRVAFWPYAMVFDLFAGPLRTWMTSPLTERKEHAEKLRADAKTWDEVAHSRVATAAEREMARQLVKLLREQAEEVDL